MAAEVELAKDQAKAQATAAEEVKTPALDKNGKPKKSPKREALEWALTIVAALVIATLVRSFVGELVSVDGDSMYPTLHHREVMVTSKLKYGTSSIGIPFTSLQWRFTVGGDPERFDVVVCRYPGRTENFVKRVIGLPGDTIQIRSGYLYIKAAGEDSYTRYDEKFLHERMRDDYGPYTVPEGHYFMMGDNRNNSNDSRSSRVGAISRDMIVGHVKGVLWHSIPSTLEDSGMKH